MTQLDYAQRQMVSRSIVLAVARERQRHVAEAEALRAEMQEHVAALRADMAALHRQLTAAREEAALLHEWRDAHIAHRRARQELLTLYRQRMLERAWEAERDPTMPLH